MNVTAGILSEQGRTREPSAPFADLSVQLAVPVTPPAGGKGLRGAAAVLSPDCVVVIRGTHQAVYS